MREQMEIVVEAPDVHPHRCPAKDYELTTCKLRTISKCPSCGKLWWASYYNLNWQEWKPVRWYHFRLKRSVADVQKDEA